MTSKRDRLILLLVMSGIMHITHIACSGVELANPAHSKLSYVSLSVCGRRAYVAMRALVASDLSGSWWLLELRQLKHGQPSRSCEWCTCSLAVAD